jgi:mevalonate kinase
LNNILYTGQANGKLLLTGEYLVLHAALGLAFPARRSQSLQVLTHKEEGLFWRSKEFGKTWFEARLSLPDLKLTHSSDPLLGEKLKDLLHSIRKYQADFLQNHRGLWVETDLDFPRNWGLGTSSTLLWLMSDWAGMDSYTLLVDTFGGSGYDIACAKRNKPLLFQNDQGRIRVEEVSFSPPYLKDLYLGFSGKKQHSGNEVRRFLEMDPPSTDLIERISGIARQVLSAKDLSTFNSLLTEHENLMSDLLEIPQARTGFPGFPGLVKSLGAWGGDFLLFSWEGEMAELAAALKPGGIEALYRFEDLLFI